jgi:hypothetical protein
MEEKELFGTLFNSIPLHTEEHLETILNTIDKEQAVFFIVQAVKYAYHQGSYSIGESEVISKCIRVLTKN